MDKPEVSREFARQYDLPFPLLEDREQALIKAYVGVDESGFSIPGMVIVAPDGTIVFRKIGEAPGDRIYASGLLALVDRIAEERKLEPTDRPRALGGYAPLERIQVRVGAALGLASRYGGDTGLGFSAGTTIAGLYPLGRYVTGGALVRGLALARERLDLDLALRLRLPTLYDNGELYLQIPIGAALDVAGPDTNESTGWNTGATLGMQFALRPSLAIYLEIDAIYHRFAGRGGADDLVELRYTAGGGVGWLF